MKTNNFAGNTLDDKEQQRYTILKAYENTL